MHSVVLWRKTTPDRYTRFRNVWFSKWYTWDYGRRKTGDGWAASTYADLLNYWSVFANAGGNWRAQDDRLTRGGPAAVAQPGYYAGFGFNSDSRKKVSLSNSYNF